VAAADSLAASLPMSYPRPLGHSASHSTELTAISSDIQAAMCATECGERGLRMSRRFEATTALDETEIARDDDWPRY
jgi:hypothetical protein